MYGALRYQIALDACLDSRLPHPDKLPPEILTALRLGSYEILLRGTPRRAAVHSWVEVSKQHHKKLSGLVNAVLRRISWPESLPLATRLGYPEWLYHHWQQHFGMERAEEIARGMNEPEPLWLFSHHPQATHQLIQEGCEVRLGPVEHTLAVRPSQPLQTLTAFKKGWVQPQNPSSSLPVRLLDPHPGERILDLASGQGIKAAQLARLGAKPFSIDQHAGKLKRAEENLSRLGLSGQSMPFNLTDVPDILPAEKVLLDAPCSGTGTLRGNPELRSRVSENTVNELRALQQRLLSTAAELTTPGGLLVYAVCALTQQESANVIEQFLLEHPHFQVESFLLDLPALNTPIGSYILPLNGLDGFFIARLRRT